MKWSIHKHKYSVVLNRLPVFSIDSICVHIEGGPHPTSLISGWQMMTSYRPPQTPDTVRLIPCDVKQLKGSWIMYEAFELIRLVEKLPLKICAIATWGEPFCRATGNLISWPGGHYLESPHYMTTPSLLPGSILHCSSDTVTMHVTSEVQSLAGPVLCEIQPWIMQR